MGKTDAEFFMVDRDTELSFRVPAGAKKEIVVMVTGDASEVSLETGLSGEGSEAQIRVIVLAQGDRNVRLSTLQHHSGPGAKSDLLVKSVISGSASVTFDGLIRIESDAHRSDAYQRGESLLLSSGAHAHNRPTLEILANDVRCTHGSVTKPLSADEIWYLASRGIGETEAKRLLTVGFIGSALADMDEALCRKAVREAERFFSNNSV